MNSEPMWGYCLRAEEKKKKKNAENATLISIQTLTKNQWENIASLGHRVRDRDREDTDWKDNSNKLAEFSKFQIYILSSSCKSIFIFP